ncbi:MAG: hypothetical protein KatS3mg038_0143 [Candidatus Kapaibacterium sp.]|nr:MAG: hypothetical protein KatS3mg038_0143 [Candidatus Kapabacteria bacterium]
MAQLLTTETLGALIDKLAIVDLKLWHCQELLFGRSDIPPNERQELEAKNTSLLRQRAQLIETIDRWIAQAVENPSSLVITSPQNKLYGRFRTDVEL